MGRRTYDVFNSRIHCVIFFAAAILLVLLVLITNPVKLPQLLQSFQGWQSGDHVTENLPRLSPLRRGLAQTLPWYAMAGSAAARPLVSGSVASLMAARKGRPGRAPAAAAGGTPRGRLVGQTAMRMAEERNATLGEIYGAEWVPRVVAVSDELPPQDLGAETYGCWKRSYRNEGCPQAFMDGTIRPAGFNGSGPYLAYMQAARNASSQQVHAPFILSLPNGEMLAAWFDGLEGRHGVAIVVSRLPRGPAGQGTWTRPQVVSMEPTRSAQNPVMWYDAPTRTVYLMHTSQRALLGQGTSDVRWLRSKDHGRTWSSPAQVFRRPGAFIRNAMVTGVRGEWLLPMYYTPVGYNGFAAHYCTMRRSRDKGRTWAETRISHPGQFLAQPTTVRLSQSPPVLVTWMRDRRNLFVYVSKSHDDGKTWSTPKRTRLPNNNSAIQALRLLSGAIAMVFNNKGGVLDRWPITIALSYDGGESWPYLRDLDREPLHLAYPALTQTSDGLIHVVYSYHREAIKYVSVTEEWIKAGNTYGTFKGDKERNRVAVPEVHTGSGVPKNLR